jgi:hypothetical protein
MLNHSLAHYNNKVKHRNEASTVPSNVETHSINVLLVENLVLSFLCNGFKFQLRFNWVLLSPITDKHANDQRYEDQSLF